MTKPQTQPGTDMRWASAADLACVRPGTLGFAPRPKSKQTCAAVVPVIVVSVDRSLPLPLFTVREQHGGLDEAQWQTWLFDTQISRLYYRSRSHAKVHA